MKRLSKAVPVGVITLLISSVSPLEAQQLDIPSHGPIPFAAYDRDGDGAITEVEFNTVRGERIANRAAAGMPMRGQANAPQFADFDSNGDGRLSPQELSTGQQAQQKSRGGMGQGPGMRQGRNAPVFSDFDLDGNGAITEQELNEARSKRISERAQQGYPMRGLGNAPVFADIDSNGDGAVSAEEFAAHQQTHRPER